MSSAVRLLNRAVNCQCWHSGLGVFSSSLFLSPQMPLIWHLLNTDVVTGCEDKKHSPRNTNCSPSVQKSVFLVCGFWFPNDVRQSHPALLKFFYSGFCVVKYAWRHLCTHAINCCLKQLDRKWSLSVFYLFKLVVVK